MQRLWKWRVDGQAGEAELLIPEDEGTSTCPAWDGVSERLFFLSDRSGAMELWSAAPSGDMLRLHSRFGRDSFEPRSLSVSGGRAVVCAGADLHMFCTTASDDLAADGKPRAAPPTAPPPLDLLLQSDRDGTQLSTSR